MEAERLQDEYDFLQDRPLSLLDLSLPGFLAPFLPKTKRRDAITFIEDVLGHDPWDMPRQIIEALEHPRAAVAVKACHSSGKTFTAAELALWWTCEVGGVCLTTAPTTTQVRKLLWGEIKTAHKQAKETLGGHLIDRELRYSPSNYAIGMSTDKGVNLQGFHADKMLIIVDEAPGVAEDQYDAIDGIRAGGDVRLLVIGNPVISGGRFHNAFKDGRRDWKTFTIDAFDTPNLIDLNLHDPEHLQDFLSWDRDDPRLDVDIRPYLTGRRWVWDKAHSWGLNNPQWQSRVRGQFPTFSDSAIYNLSWLEAAALRDRKSVMYDEEWPIEGGLDVAGPGTDETALTIRDGPIIQGQWAWQHADTQSDVIEICHKYMQLALLHEKRFVLKVDATGLGYHYMNPLKKAGIPVIPVNFSMSPRDKERFALAKDEYYWQFRDALEEGRVIGLTDEETISQAVAMQYGHNSRGKITVETKDELRRRGLSSPDRLESVILAFCKTQALTPSVRLRRPASGRTYARRRP